MTGITIILIYVLIFLAIYPFAIYPIILYILSKVNNRKIKNDEKFTPEITFLISAYNEELYIEKCINSIYNSEYPKDKITIFVGSDGSNDKTNSILDKLNKEHSTQISGSISNISSPTSIASTGQYFRQRPQLIQVSMIVYAIN